MTRFGRSGRRGDVAFSDYLAEQEREAAATDAHFDAVALCGECLVPLKDSETDLCADCKSYIAAEAKRDAEEDDDMRAPRNSTSFDPNDGSWNQGRAMMPEQDS